MAETKFTTSFIPKKPVQTVTTGGKIKKGKGSNLLMLISLAVFLIVAVMAVGTFLYDVKLGNDIEKIKQELVQSSESLDQQLIFEASRLDTRLKTIQRLLDEHLSPSQIFALLETYTIANLRFNNLSFSFGGDGNLSLSGNGSGIGYQSIIQQSDAYGRSEYLRDVIFSSLQNSPDDIVSFSFQSVVDPRVINYREAYFSNNNETFNNSENQENDILEELQEQEQEDNFVDDQQEDSFDLQQELINEEQ
jgi:hypothetical protein